MLKAQIRHGNYDYAGCTDEFLASNLKLLTGIGREYTPVEERVEQQPKVVLGSRKPYQVAAHILSLGQEESIVARAVMKEISDTTRLPSGSITMRSVPKQRSPSPRKAQQTDDAKLQNDEAVQQAVQQAVIQDVIQVSNEKRSSPRSSPTKFGKVKPSPVKSSPAVVPVQESFKLLEEVSKPLTDGPLVYTRKSELLQSEEVQERPEIEPSRSVQPVVSQNDQLAPAANSKRISSNKRNDTQQDDYNTPYKADEEPDSWIQTIASWTGVGKKAKLYPDVHVDVGQLDSQQASHHKKIASPLQINFHHSPPNPTERPVTRSQDSLLTDDEATPRPIKQRKTLVKSSSNTPVRNLVSQSATKRVTRSMSKK